MAGNDGSFNDALRNAQKRAVARNKESLSPTEWPNADEVDLAQALQALTLEAYESGIKISMGCLQDGSGLFVRLSYPKIAEAPQAGLTALTVSNTLEKALRKASLLGTTLSDKVWRPDAFAK